MHVDNLKRYYSHLQQEILLKRDQQKYLQWPINGTIPDEAQTYGVKAEDVNNLVMGRPFKAWRFGNIHIEISLIHP